MKFTSDMGMSSKCQSFWDPEHHHDVSRVSFSRKTSFWSLFVGLRPNCNRKNGSLVVTYRDSVKLKQNGSGQISAFTTVVLQHFRSPLVSKPWNGPRRRVFVKTDPNHIVFVLGLKKPFSACPSRPCLVEGSVSFLHTIVTVEKHSFRPLRSF